MPSSAFRDSLFFVLRWEGGYVDHPADPGGRTNRGITQGVYDRWRSAQGLPTRHVHVIEETEVEATSETHYWNPPRCDLLRRRLDLVQFDTGVNMGPGRTVRFLQGASPARQRFLLGGAPQRYLPVPPLTSRLSGFQAGACKRLGYPPLRLLANEGAGIWLMSRP